MTLLGQKKTEARRQQLQAELDSKKSQLERNKLGQFSTPYPLAKEILRESLKFLPKKTPVRFLDPAVGTGVFFSALLATKGSRGIESATGYDIDPHYGIPAAELWDNTCLSYRLADFTKAEETPLVNLIVCNPPYVRHHHLGSDKSRLNDRAKRLAGINLSQLAGLYCYFIALAHKVMEPGAVAAWLIPSEFMDVNYGAAIKEYLLGSVTLLRIHRFDPESVQFDDALVSSAVVWLRNEKPTADATTNFSFGSSISKPLLSRLISRGTLTDEHKWTRFPVREARNNQHGMPVIGDFFDVKRGLATGANDVFILSETALENEGIPLQFVRPILPSPRHLIDDVIAADAIGNPISEPRLFHLDCRLSPAEIESLYPSLWRYLEKHRAVLEAAGAYLVTHRKEWYLQENRPAAPILCTYMGRQGSKDKNPFRFLLNLSKATAANAYHMLYPKGPWASRQTPQLLRSVWDTLQTLHESSLVGEGRIYGGGLHKMEPKELAKVPAPRLAELLGRNDTQLKLAV